MFLLEIPDQSSAASVWALKWVIQWYMDEEFCSYSGQSQVNLTINRCKHACGCTCVSQLYCNFHRYLSVNQIMEAWCFCWCCEHVSWAFRDKMNQSDPIPADSYLCSTLTAWNLLRIFLIIFLSNSFFFPLISLKPDIADGQTIQNNHLFAILTRLLTSCFLCFQLFLIYISGFICSCII